MRDTLNEYLEKFKEKNYKRKKVLSIFLMLALVVTVGVSWKLKIIGISMTDDETMEKELEKEEAETEEVEIAEAETMMFDSDGQLLLTGDDDSEEAEEIVQTAEVKKYLKTSDGRPGVGDIIYLDSSGTAWFTDAHCYAVMYYNISSENPTGKFLASNESTQASSTRDTLTLWSFTLPDDFDSNLTIKFGRKNDNGEYNSTKQLGLESGNNYVIYEDDGGYFQTGTWRKSFTYEGEKLYIDRESFGNIASATLKFNGVTKDVTSISSDEKYLYYVFNVGDDVEDSTDITLSYGTGNTLTFHMSDMTGQKIVKLSGGTIDTTEQSYSRYIYFDATYSQLKYDSAETSGYNNSIPTYYQNERNVVCRAFDASGNYVDYPMTKVDGSSYMGTLVYKTNNEVSGTYNSFQFYSEECWYWECSAKTKKAELVDESKNCFVAHTSDTSIYNNVLRDGYWIKYGEIKDVEKNTDSVIVDIGKATKSNATSTLWLDATMYDYYSDYELNGYNRDTYNNSTAYSNDIAVNHRRYMNFKQFNQALSEYYAGSSDKVTNPIYTGHFQPNVEGFGCQFSVIASTLDLYGYQNYYKFISNNNSILNSSNDDSEAERKFNKGGYYDYATIGLVNNATYTDPVSKIKYPVSKGTTSLIEPHFNESFLQGSNSKKAVVGKVYQDVSFPFTQRKVFEKTDGYEEPVNYWWFDSASTTLYLKENEEDIGKYFLNGTVGTKDLRSKNVDSTGEPTNDVSNTYGFFPFNETAANSNASFYNYGFGSKITIDFRMTEDGKVTGEDGEKYDAKFRFSGDDDVWVFLDDQLVLDCGGGHGRVVGLINFAQNKSYVTKIKKAADSNTTYGPKSSDAAASTVKASYTYTAGGVDGNESITDKFYYVQENILEKLGNGKYDTTKPHKLVIYYMERGQWESNLSLAFNMPVEDKLKVSKNVDVTTNNVNDLFKSFFTTAPFTFSIKNMVTHFGKAVAGAADEIYDDIIFARDFSQGLTWSDNINTEEVKKGTNNNGIVASYNGKGNADPITKTNVIKYMGKDTVPKNVDQKQKRLIIFQPDSGGTVDITNMAYLGFWVSIESDSANINKLFIQLTDKDGRIAYGTLYGKTEGTLTNWRWSELTVSLSGMTYDSGFDKANVQSIGIEYDDNVYVFFDDFVFKPTNIVSKLNGFTQRQNTIPDYGSALTGQLENAVGATYTSSKDEEHCYAVDKNGNFTLTSKETATFVSQFRKGSYISLTEDLDSSQTDLYETTITVKEDSKTITAYSYASSSTVTPLSGTLTPTKQAYGTGGMSIGLDDGRVEKYLATIASETGAMDGNKYSEGKTVNTSGEKPSEVPTFVFRSFESPDSENANTHIILDYTNIVRTGSIEITKSENKTGELNGNYTFTIQFSNIGGSNLEGSATVPAQTFTIQKGQTYRIEGIPVGTEYTITESTDDNSTIHSVTENGVSKTFSKETKSVSGKVEVDTEAATGGKSYIYNFTNAKKPVTQITVQKIWDDSDNTSQRPEGGIYVKLYRSTNPTAEWGSASWVGVGDYINLVSGNDFTYKIDNLDVYVDYTQEVKQVYYYRIAEYTKSGDVYTEINSAHRLTNYELPVYSEKNTATSDGTDDGIINAADTGVYNVSSGKLIVTNTYKAPSYNLPKTGGSGTKLHIYSGLAIMLGCLYYGYVMKRKNVERRKV